MVANKLVSIIELFKNITKEYPEKTAIIYENELLNYEKLNILSDQLAILIRRKCNDLQNKNTNVVIAICITRNIEMMVAILGVLKAGAAYVIINPDLPLHGIEYILNNSESLMLLECNSTIDMNKLEKLRSNTSSVIHKVDIKILANLQESYGDYEINLDSLAYIMYTSGTTGFPKGVRISHRSLSYFCQVYAHKMGIVPGVVIDYLLSPVFTGSIPCYFPPLLFGATLLIQANNIILTPKKYILNLEKYNATILKFTPTIFNLLFSNLTKLGQEPLKIVLSGEPLLYPQIKGCRKYKLWQLYNQYGFTECVAGFSSYLINFAKNYASNYVPVGEAYSGREMLIVDDKLNAVTDGNEGELLVGGLGLADGYQKLPDETSKKFIVIDNKRYFRSGDLVRLNFDGNLEVLRRNDNQIKINGIRIETAEIESRILEIHNIRGCWVGLTDVKGVVGQELVAYYTCDKVGAVCENQIKEYLNQYLPAYMIPQFYVLVSEFPYTTNGKIDRNMLVTKYPVAVSKTLHLPVDTELQRQLQEYWHKILQIEKKLIGKNSDFFQLGGNSLKGYQVLTRVNEHYHVHLVTQDVFRYRTIEAQEQYIIADSLNNFKDKSSFGNIDEEF